MQAKTIIIILTSTRIITIIIIFIIISNIISNIVSIFIILMIIVIISCLQKTSDDFLETNDMLGELNFLNEKGDETCKPLIS